MYKVLIGIGCVYVLFYILNFIWLSIYCRIAEKIDIIKDTEVVEGKKSKLAENRNEKRSLKQLLKSIYRELDHYMYGWMRYWIIKVGKIPSNRIRKNLYQYVFAMKLSKGTVISAGCEIRSPWNIRLGKCIVAGNCILDGRSGIEIEDNVVLGMHVHIWTQEHAVNNPMFAVDREHKGKVMIRRRAWVCSDTTILPGIEIGEGAVVATRGCVTKDCESFGIYGGVPAKKIGERSHELVYELSGKPHWHFN